MHREFWAVLLLSLVVNVAGTSCAQLIPVMHKIDLTVTHCTDTRESRRMGEEESDTYHRNIGSSECGYYFYVQRGGHVIAMRPLRKIEAHTRGYNFYSIRFAYEGRLDSL